MKFYVGRDKKNGERLKKNIKDQIKDARYISVKHLCDMFGEKSTEDYCGWDCENLRKKMRLRQTKEGWYLYFPPTIELPFGDTMGTVSDATTKDDIDPENVSINGNVQLDVLGLRTCRVISKRKDRKITQLGFFHGWYQLKVPKTGGDSIMYPIGLVEMEDGSVKQVKPERIIFGWEE